jgi:hypothetical protein
VRAPREAARLLERAIASSGPGGVVYAGTSAERRFNSSFGEAVEAAGNGQRDLHAAVAQAEQIASGLES